MNRLIIVGNGFDLAHNLKTSYHDFIQDYLTNSINAFYQNKSHNDLLLSINYKFAGAMYGQITIDNKSAIEEFKKFQNNEHLNVKLNSTLLDESLEKITNLNWVDLETSYFDKLLQSKLGDTYNFNRVKTLNGEFEFLKVKLEEYLSKEQSDSYVSEAYLRIFLSLINYGEMVNPKHVNSPLPENMLLLSFNYTNTLLKYQEACSYTIPTTVNYIHGELNSLANPIIFGFGDEYNKRYLEFEDQKNHELFKHIKSFGYFKTPNYHNLERFIESGEYQVFIMGHSLGLSDRTLLRQIFENRNCQSIKIFYYKKNESVNDFTEKTYDIASHFSDKIMMRRKIVNLQFCTHMPQVNEN